MYYRWFGVSAGDIGYTGTVTAGTVPTAGACVATPGFEIAAVILVLVVAFPLVKKFRKNRK
jgi:hypothetical protein